ncbi:C-type lectin domain family 1 member B-like [Lynx rufus]|uniref:C-type lectin domain family 1 member B-like n=1 Tax=Lynx rufus TaxID=61384 RepID=UPI001F126F6A|nr:C-type lectin domain family 1 member B-like [Lynx rufus]
MNETHTTYMDIKHPPKKQMPKKRPSVPFVWCLAVVILGILCFLLLVTTAVLGSIVFQGHTTNETQKLPLDNRTQQDESTFKNTTIIEFPLNTGHKRNICKTQWSCCGDKCYHFSRDFTTFQDSKNICKNMGATLVKIEDEEELNFIRSQMHLYTWIGLSRKGTSMSWKWEDNSYPFLQVISDWKETKGGNCASMTKMRMIASDCYKLLPFTCEKRIPCVATS